jgi:4-hydroxy-tetrahydrodipicolinate reductase
MSAIPLALIGMGRMGRALAELAPARGFDVVARIDHAQPITRDALANARIAIEFTVPGAAVANVLACAKLGCPVVVGTTGWYDQLPMLRTELEKAGAAMLYAPNFSVGVAIFDRVVAEASRLLAGAGFDGHLVETHHTAKKDAPSGTAAALARSAEAASGKPMPITSVRVGAVPGTHEVVFDASFEQVRLVHEARDRRVFAEGALAAARWLATRSDAERRGVFTMQDVLAMPASTAHTGKR